MERVEKLAYRTSELCRALGVGRTTVWRLVKAGALPRPLRLGGVVLWRADDLRGALDKLREQQQREGAR